MVALASGVLFEGYQGDVGRTWPCLAPGDTPSPAQRAPYERWALVLDALMTACRPGARASDVVAAYRTTGGPLETAVEG